MESTAPDQTGPDHRGLLRGSDETVLCSRSWCRNREQAERVTVRAVAAEAGLPIATISRLLNGAGNVAPRPRERMREVVDRPGDGARDGRRGGALEHAARAVEASRHLWHGIDISARAESRPPPMFVAAPAASAPDTYALAAPQLLSIAEATHCLGPVDPTYRGVPGVRRAPRIPHRHGGGTLARTTSHGAAEAKIHWQTVDKKSRSRSPQPLETSSDL